MKSVLLVDDHPVVGVGLRLAFLDSNDFHLAETVSTPARCIETIEDHRPDALVIDLVFEGRIHLGLVAQCRAALPNAAIVVFSSLPEAIYGPRARAAGADAYLSKAADLSALSRLLAETVASGRPSPGETRAAAASDPQGSRGTHLTQREIEIARYVGRGLSTAVIARALGISANTVAVHRDNIRKKLMCRDTKDLVARLARMDGFGDVPG